MKKKVSVLFIMLFLCMVIIPSAFAAERAPHLIDDANLLSSSEEATLVDKLDAVSEKHNMDVIILTVDSIDGYTPKEYADDFYDTNGYGKDGVLLLLNMGERDCCISTAGLCITAFTDKGQDYICDQFLDDLGDEKYLQAFEKFANLSDQFITQAKIGEPYDSGNLPKKPFSIGKSLLISLIIGLVLALIITAIMIGQLKSVRFQSSANNYVKRNSLKLTENRDLFLYAHVDKRERPKESSSSGGGSSTHKSSSGVTHGGSSRKF